MYKKYIYELKKDIYDYIKDISKDKCGIYFNCGIREGFVYVRMYLTKKENKELRYNYRASGRVKTRKKIKIKYIGRLSSSNNIVMDYLVMDFVHNEQEYQKFLNSILQDVKETYFEFNLKN